MKNIKKILTMILVLVMCLNFGTLDSKAAASVSIALSTGSTSIGGSVSVTVSVSGSDISAYDIYVSYDSSVLQYNSGSGAAQANGGGGTIRLVGTGAGSTTLSFTAVGNGSCYISTSGTECYDINYNQISISHGGASVSVSTPTPSDNGNNNNNNDNDKTEDTTTEEDDRSANCNLKSLQISPGTLEPAFSPSTTSYFVQVDEDVTSMVVSAVAEDDKATTTVRGAGLIEPGANTVTVTVTAENGAVKVYTLSVAAGEVLGDAKTTIDGIEYDFVQSSNGLEIPEGYNEITAEYKDWEVLAFESPNKKIILVCLKPNDINDGEDDELKWFIYDKDKESFLPYREYSSEFNRYVIIEAPEGVVIPEGFEKTELDIGGIGEKVTVYKSDNINDKNIYLVYAINIAGDEGFYWYDAKEKAFLRYAEKEITEPAYEVATETMATPAEPEVIEKTEPKDEGFFSKKNLGIISIALGVIAFLLIIVIITLATMLKSKNSEEEAKEDADDMTGVDSNVSFDENIPEKESLSDQNIINDSAETVVTEEMVEEEARKAYEEDREISQNIPASFDLSNMQDGNEVEDRNISIMSFKKKEENKEEKPEEKPEENKEEKPEEKPEEKIEEKPEEKPEENKEEKPEERSEEKIEEKTEEKSDEKPEEDIEIIKFNFPDNNDDLDEEKIKKAFENDFEKQAEAINNKIKNDYDAEKDSAFSDDSDK
ncbi:MAG: cadherin-like beta sandwich domain-containing protein [Lachnospiraceae bacterium]|nr:cadherin-like beta sandwich domain-containing protein [Lachnospiraceae bacterium]